MKNTTAWDGERLLPGWLLFSLLDWGWPPLEFLKLMADRL
jgi:hypothetical protein